jgi:hypothetical protein
MRVLFRLPVSMRRPLLDGGLVMVLLVASSLLGADPFLGTRTQTKMIDVSGSVEIWRLRILW